MHTGYCCALVFNGGGEIKWLNGVKEMTPIGCLCWRKRKMGKEKDE